MIKATDINQSILRAPVSKLAATNPSVLKEPFGDVKLSSFWHGLKIELGEIDALSG